MLQLLLGGLAGNRLMGPGMAPGMAPHHHHHHGLSPALPHAHAHSHALPGLAGFGFGAPMAYPGFGAPMAHAHPDYYSSEERLIHGRHSHHHHHRGDRDRSKSAEHRLLHGFERMDGDCQGALLDNKVYELDIFDCAKKCYRRPDCAGFSFNLYVQSPQECYLKAESCSTPMQSTVWVFYRKSLFLTLSLNHKPHP